MAILVLGIILFFAVHSVSIVNESWRNGVVERIGLNAWKGVYSLIALAGFVMICYGYGIARQDPVVLYSPPAWTRHITMLLMLFVFPLFLAANLPGKIKAATKQPLLAATKIWALAHLLANGTLADVLLFGSFLAWAIVDRVSMKTRTQRPIPGLASPYNDVFAIVSGLVLYAVFMFWAHAALFGVALA
jgi:uncharacterized membrane protein